MNPLFKKLYKHKKTRVRDPNLPPPPNLFSTVRDLKLTQGNLDELGQRFNQLLEKIERLESNNRKLQNQVNLLIQQLNRRK